MIASLSRSTPEFNTSLSIHAFTPASCIMSSGRQEYGYRLNDSGVYDPRSNSYRTGSYSQGSSHGNRNPDPVPASADTTSRSRGMNIEEILNPSDEGTRPYQEPQISRSYEAETTVSRNPGSLQGNRVPGSGPRSYGANASTRSRGSSRPRPRSRGSGSPEVPSRTRAFRPDYTCEEEHFIWYLRNDVRICWAALLLSLEILSGVFFRLSRKHSREQTKLTLKCLSSVSIRGMLSPTLSMLASLRTGKGDAKFPDSNANTIES